MKLYENGAYLIQGKDIVINSPEAVAAVASKTGKQISAEEAKKETIAYGILKTIIHLGIWKNSRLNLIN